MSAVQLCTALEVLSVKAPLLDEEAFVTSLATMLTVGRYGDLSVFFCGCLTHEGAWRLSLMN
jgi:hypothetical protein